MISVAEHQLLIIFFINPPRPLPCPFLPFFIRTMCHSTLMLIVVVLKAMQYLWYLQKSGLVNSALYYLSSLTF